MTLPGLDQLIRAQVLARGVELAKKPDPAKCAYCEKPSMTAAESKYVAATYNSTANFPEYHFVSCEDHRDRVARAFHDRFGRSLHALCFCDYL